ncbi:unnamed protein product, partial [Prorocentrum cordatum]
RPRRVTADTGAEEVSNGTDANSSAPSAAPVCDIGMSPPCCAGCTSAYMNKIMENRELDIFGMLVSAVLDIAAVAITIVAASAAFGHVEEKDHVDIQFKRRAKYSAEIAHFELTSPLAQDFINHVLDNTFRANDGEIPGPGHPRARRDIDLAYERARGGSEVKQVVKRGEVAFGLAGDVEDGANFQDVSSWEPETKAYPEGGVDNVGRESQYWQEFWDQGKTVIHKDSSEQHRWVPRIVVPRKCLGLAEEEKILGAWVEVPMLDVVVLAPLLITTIIMYVFMVFVKEEIIVSMYRLGYWEDAHDDKVGSAAIWSLGFLVVGFILLLAWLFSSTRHVVVLTDCRVFYIRYQAKVWWLLKFVPQLRLDVFRHDHEITYGSLMTSAPTLYQRATRAPWTPGTVFMQPGIFGLLRLTRGRGNVMNVYQTISQLTKPGKPQFLTEKAIQDAGVSVQVCRQYVEDNMQKVMDHIWR